MNVRTLCLAILHSGDATGYEIKKLSVEGAYRHFVDASFGSIYPALARLEHDGLVTVREEVQSGKPARKVYSITEQGHAELVAQLSALPAPDIYRSQFLLVAMKSELVPVSLIRAAIEKRLDELRAQIGQLNEIVACEVSPGARWAAMSGITCMTASLHYLEQHRGELEAMASDADVDASCVAAE